MPYYSRIILSSFYNRLFPNYSGIIDACLIITLLPHSKHPSCTLNTNFLDWYIFMDKSTFLGQPLATNFCTLDNNRSRSVHLRICITVRGESSKLSNI